MASTPGKNSSAWSSLPTRTSSTCMKPGSRQQMAIHSRHAGQSVASGLTERSSHKTERISPALMQTEKSSTSPMCRMMRRCLTITTTNPKRPFPTRNDLFLKSSAYKFAASNVSPPSIVPLSKPFWNQLFRCFDVPCVKLSGTTYP